MANTTGIGWGRDVWGSGAWGRDFLSDTITETLTLTDGSTATYSNLSHTVTEAMTLADIDLSTATPQPYYPVTTATNTWTTLSSSTRSWTTVSAASNSWTRV